MKAFSKILAITLLVSMPLAHGWSMPKLTLGRSLTGIGVIAACAAALQLYTQKTKTEKQIRMRSAIADEETTLCMMQRTWQEEIVGQIGKEKELVGIDENGKAMYEKRPATGIIGRSHEVVTKNVMPVATCLIVLQTTTRKMLEGFSSWNGRLGKMMEGFVNMLPAEFVGESKN